MTVNEKQTAQLQFLFTPEGFLIDPAVQNLKPKHQRLKERFEEDKYGALYQMGLEEKPEDLSASAFFLFLVADRFFQVLTSFPELEVAREDVRTEPSEEVCRQLLDAVPFAIGSEYLTETWILRIFEKLSDIFRQEIRLCDGTVAMYLAEKSQHLKVPERIFFHLVESREEVYPFAFLATYATRSEDGKLRHMPLEYALTEYKNNRTKLLNLLSCLNQAAEVSELVSGFMESGELFHPLRLTSGEAYAFLKQTEAIEKTGILCRIPNWWKKKAASVSMSIRLGEEQPAMLGFDTLVSMRPRLVADGQPLTEEDIQSLLAQTEGLAYLKGKWVEVNHEKLKKLLAEMEKYQGEMTLMETLRLELGTGKDAEESGPAITNGTWLSSLLQSLRNPGRIRKLAVPKSFQTTLRPYQKNGYTWLNYMSQLGFGACLADDMGLGKTVQVLAYLERLRAKEKKARVLLVVPASLVGNWQKEASRFAPSMELLVLHGKTSSVLEQMLKEHPTFLTVTTYGMASRIAALQEIPWTVVILDEAQAIKNPAARQTKEIKKLSADMRIAMTGTPIENDLTNLWSLFDFLNRGLLGTPKEFHEFCKNLSDHPEGYAKLKAMVAPFMLRRLKTDRRVIADLPEKLEKIDYVTMSKKQVVMYRKVVAELEEKLADADGMKRRGLVLATITKLKQICNHPDQYLGQSAFSEAESGKLLMLREICETIYEKREQVLVFTQFKEITESLADFLEGIFHARGYVLHGGTRAAKRTKMVESFQGEDYVPFIVLSVKAGGIGLNLTKASHVIHFDRWWNPAVENQATDRAFRIGQTKNVMVHKLVCQGTIEEKIDAMIESKKELAEHVIGSGGEKWITELGNEELLSLFRLG